MPGLAAADSYNVVTRDPRGEVRFRRAAPGLTLFEGRTCRRSSWLTTSRGRSSTEQHNGSADRHGSAVSYGGGIQLSTAGIDHRVDAIVPVIALELTGFRALPQSRLQDHLGRDLLLSLTLRRARVDPRLYLVSSPGRCSVSSSRPTGFPEGEQPGTVVGDSTTPTLFIQGTVDNLFPCRRWPMPGRGPAGPVANDLVLRRPRLLPDHGEYPTAGPRRSSARPDDGLAGHLRRAKGDTTASRAQVHLVDQDNSSVHLRQVPNDRVRSAAGCRRRRRVQCSSSRAWGSIPGPCSSRIHAGPDARTITSGVQHPQRHLSPGGFPTVTFDTLGAGDKASTPSWSTPPRVCVLGNNVTPIR